MHAVVLTFDQFPLSLLGCYGNAEVKTPTLNRIAAESVVFDQHFGEDFSPQPLGHAWWSGCYHFPRDEAVWLSQMPSLPNLLGEAGVNSEWLTDDENAPIVPLPREAQATVVQDFDRLIERGCERLRESSNAPGEQRLLWLKAGRPVWEDVRTAENQDGRIAAVERVERIDSALRPFWKQILSLGQSRPVLFLFTAGRGLLLNERTEKRKLSAEATEESVHLPLIGSHSQNPGGERCREFTQPMDVTATLLDFFAAGPFDKIEGFSFLPKICGDGASARRNVVTSGRERCWESLRTADFHSIRWAEHESGEKTQQQLFLKPEDVWDWQDVSAQEPEMTEILSRKMDAFLEAAEKQLPLVWPRDWIS